MSNGEIAYSQGGESLGLSVQALESMCWVSTSVKQGTIKCFPKQGSGFI